jgi:heterotetrameric sarcosine oxidase delta subunit
MRRNTTGWQDERWFHRDGCRRWLTVTRNTSTNEIRQ